MPTTLKITMFFTMDALFTITENEMPSLELAQRYLEYTRFTFGCRNWKVDTNEKPILLAFYRPVSSVMDDLALRAMADAIFPHGEGRLPVIFTTLVEKKRFNFDKDVCGWVPDEPEVTSQWLDFVLINVGRYSVFRTTLAHETGHAAGLDHVEDPSNLMFKTESAGGLTADQLSTIKNAYFVESS
jgi:hypothetical protein